MRLCPLQSGYTRFTFLQLVYIRYRALCNPRIYAISSTAILVKVHKICTETSVQFGLCDFLSSSLDFPPLQNFPLLKSPSSLAQVQSHLCQLNHVSTHSTPYMKCHNDLSLLYIQVLGVNIEAPPESCGRESPTQTHKAHHQTHEAPASFQWRFSPNEECNVVPTTISTCPTPRASENTCPKLQKSTLPLSEGGILTTLHNQLEIALSPILGVALSPALDPLPQLLSNLPNWLLPLSLKQILMSGMILPWKTPCS
jgi:hypothetical protein